MKMYLQLLSFIAYDLLYFEEEKDNVLSICYVLINIHPFIHSSIIKYSFEGLLYPSLNTRFQIIFPSNSPKIFKPNLKY